MITVEIEGNEHPKQAFLVTDNDEGELDSILNMLSEWEMDDMDFYTTLSDVEWDDIGGYIRIPVPQHEFGEVEDILYDCGFDNAARVMTKLREDAFDELTERLAGNGNPGD